MKNLLFIVGAVMMIGSVGACDIGLIDLSRAITQCLIGLPMLAIGAW